MNADAQAPSFTHEGEFEANPQAMDAIFQACTLYPMSASQDIVDIRGIKLWAKGRQISSELQQRLLERKLAQPLEACLKVEGGVTIFSLQQDLQIYLQSDDPLARGLQKHAPSLPDQLKHLTLHPVAQLLLTTAMATRPDFMLHAIRGMALAGTIMTHRKSSLSNIRLAMLGGLLHDIGEVYVEPVPVERSGPLDLSDHKQVVVHPRVAQLLLKNTTDYPVALTRAVGEHHERMDGSGYPARLVGGQISPFGQLLSVVEATLSLMDEPVAPLTRASFALQAVPGEFNASYAGFIFDLAHAAKEEMPTCSTLPFNDANSPMMAIAARLGQATELFANLKRQGRSPAALAIASTAIERLSRLRVAWNALGSWGLDTMEATSMEFVEIEMLWHEMNNRIYAMQRESLLLAEPLPTAERNALAVLWAGLTPAEDQFGFSTSRF